MDKAYLVRSLIVFLIMVLFAPVLAAQDVTANEYTAYRVKPGDQLEISLWKEPDMLREAPVLPDGTITYPLVGQVSVVGMTPKQIQSMLSKQLKRFYKDLQDPFLTVVVKRTNGNRVYIIGEVRNPGVFVITQPVDVLQALSLAGGLGEYADKDKIIVLRRLGGGNQQVIDFRYSAVRRGDRLDTNVVLQSGDTVVVPEKGMF